MIRAQNSIDRIFESILQFQYCSIKFFAMSVYLLSKFIKGHYWGNIWGEIFGLLDIVAFHHFD